MDEEKRKKDQKEVTEDGSISRRKFFKKMAYVAPVVMTFIASQAYAVAPTQCNPPPPCNPLLTCPPASCTPPPPF